METTRYMVVIAGTMDSSYPVLEEAEKRVEELNAKYSDMLVDIHIKEYQIMS